MLGLGGGGGGGGGGFPREMESEDVHVLDHFGVDCQVLPFSRGWGKPGRKKYQCRCLKIVKKEGQRNGGNFLLMRKGTDRRCRGRQYSAGSIKFEKTKRREIPHTQGTGEKPEDAARG